MKDGARWLVSAKPHVAIPDFVTLSGDSLLRLFYRGRLGLPCARSPRLLKTKDVAARDRQIGVGPTAPWEEFSYCGARYDLTLAGNVGYKKWVQFGSPHFCV